MELADLFNDVATVEATYRDRQFRLDVYTEKMTPEYRVKAVVLAARAQAAADEGQEGEGAEGKDETATMLADLLAGWRDGDDQAIVLKGQPFPPVYENLIKMSYPLLTTLLKAVTQYLGELANPPSATN